MASGAGIKPAAVTLTVDNIYDQIITASAELDDALVPAEGRVLTVTPQIYRLMKKSKEIILDTEIGADMRKKALLPILTVQQSLKFRLQDFRKISALCCRTNPPAAHQHS